MAWSIQILLSLSSVHCEGKREYFPFCTTHLKTLPLLAQRRVVVASPLHFSSCPRNTIGWRQSWRRRPGRPSRLKSHSAGRPLRLTSLGSTPGPATTKLSISQWPHCSSSLLESKNNTVKNDSVYQKSILKKRVKVSQCNAMMESETFYALLLYEYSKQKIALELVAWPWVPTPGSTIPTSGTWRTQMTRGRGAKEPRPTRAERGWKAGRVNNFSPVSFLC